MNSRNPEATSPQDEGRIDRRDPNPASPSGFDFRGAFDLLSIALFVFLLIWWALLPGLESLKTTDSYQSIFTTYWMLVIAVVVAALSFVVGAVAPIPRKGFLPWWLRLGIGGLAMVGIIALAITAPLVFRHAGHLRNVMSNEIAAKDRLLRTKSEEYDAALSAIKSKVEKVSQDAEKARKDLEQAIKEKKSPEEIAKLEEIAKKATKDEENLRAAQQELEQQKKQSADLLAKKDEDLRAAQRKAVEDLEKARKENEELARKLEAEAKAKAELEQKVADMAKHGDTGKSDDNKDPVGDILKTGIAAALAYINPALGAVAAELLGITLGTDFKTIVEVGDALKTVFQGGSLDPAKVKAALDKLASSISPEDREKAIKAFQSILEKFGKTDPGSKAAVDAALAHVREQMEILNKIKVNERELTTKLTQFWNEKIGPVEKATEASLYELYKTAKAAAPQLSPQQVRVAVLARAKVAGVSVVIYNQAELKMTNEP